MSRQPWQWSFHFALGPHLFPHPHAPPTCPLSASTLVGLLLPPLVLNKVAVVGQSPMHLSLHHQMKLHPPSAPLQLLASPLLTPRRFLKMYEQALSKELLGVVDVAPIQTNRTLLRIMIFLMKHEFYLHPGKLEE